MANKPRRVNSHRLPRWLQIALLGLLAVVTVVAVLFASASVRGESAPHDPKPTVTPVTPTPETTPEPEPETEPAPSFVSPAVQRFIAVGNSDGHVLRGVVGSCPDPAGSLEVSFDNGGEWAAGVIASVDARRLLQVSATSGDLVRLTALGTDCTPQVSRSFVGGTSWELDPDQPLTWYLNPDNARVVHTPTGQFEVPCDALGLSSSGSRAAVLCSDSTVSVSDSNGEAWSTPVAVPNLIAAGVVAEGFAVVSASELDCDGVRTRLLVNGALGEPGACVTLGDSTVVPTAIGGGSTGWHLWVGDSWLRSSDLGNTWG